LLVDKSARFLGAGKRWNMRNSNRIEYTDGDRRAECEGS
jgi:hypothetical protein